ncbi:hypothetical protein V2J09_015324 [Rumex salicifolius]
MSVEKERETQIYWPSSLNKPSVMTTVAKLDDELTVGERNLLRASWRIMSSIEQKEESKTNENNAKIIKGYRQKVEDELTKICDDILAILDKHLIPHANSGEAKVTSATASTDLPSTHPIRLGLALNFSVFYYEIMNSPERACQLAKQAFDEAIAELDTLSDEGSKANESEESKDAKTTSEKKLEDLIKGIHRAIS